MEFQTAKTYLKDCFDSAFSKNQGTKKARISMAHRALRMVPMNDMNLTLWAVDYCAKWKAPA